MNPASLVSFTEGVSWNRIRTLAVVVAGPGTFHRYHPVSSAWVAILILVVSDGIEVACRVVARKHRGHKPVNQSAFVTLWCGSPERFRGWA
jgi:hypothetical protein